VGASAALTEEGDGFGSLATHSERHQAHPMKKLISVASAAVAAVALFSGTAWTAERAGVQMPDTMSTQGHSLVLNGLGVREATVFNVDVYVAGLYLPARSSDPATILRPDEPKVLQMVFVHDVTRDQMTKAFREGFDKNAGSNQLALSPRVEQLLGYMTDLKKGDTLIFTSLPGAGVEVRAGGQLKGTIPGDDFAQAFFRIWLGPNPPNAGLKEGLLGRK
jgi:hypothetical protein